MRIFWDFYCDCEWSGGALAKSAYTLETHFKNVQLMVTPCKTGGVTEYGVILRGFKRAFDTINV